MAHRLRFVRDQHAPETDGKGLRMLFWSSPVQMSPDETLLLVPETAWPEMHLLLVDICGLETLSVTDSEIVAISKPEEPIVLSANCALCGGSGGVYDGWCARCVEEHDL